MAPVVDAEGKVKANPKTGEIMGGSGRHLQHRHDAGHQSCGAPLGGRASGMHPDKVGRFTNAAWRERVVLHGSHEGIH